MIFYRPNQVLSAKTQTFRSATTLKSQNSQILNLDLHDSVSLILFLRPNQSASTRYIRKSSLRDLHWPECLHRLQSQPVQEGLRRSNHRSCPKAHAPLRWHSLLLHKKINVKFLFLQLSKFLQELHRIGGPTFMVLNLAPVSCCPAFLVHSLMQA